MYFPCFYTLREFIYHYDKLEPGEGDGRGRGRAQAEVLVGRAMGKMRAALAEDMRSAALVLVPQDVVMQTAVPPHLRVPFISATGLLWVYLLSSSRGADVEADADADADADTDADTDADAGASADADAGARGGDV